MLAATAPAFLLLMVAAFYFYQSLSRDTDDATTAGPVAPAKASASPPVAPGPDPRIAATEAQAAAERDNAKRLAEENARLAASAKAAADERAAAERQRIAIEVEARRHVEEEARRIAAEKAERERIAAEAARRKAEDEVGAERARQGAPVLLEQVRPFFQFRIAAALPRQEGQVFAAIKTGNDRTVVALLAQKTTVHLITRVSQ